MLIAAIIAIGGGIWWYRSSATDIGNEVAIQPKRGTFQVVVTVTGELQAKNSIDIDGPEGARAEGIWQMKIARLIPEGTVVKSGDWVADIDKSEVASKLRDAELGIQKAEAQYTQTSLDSALTLSSARDEITNLKYNLEEKQLQLEQSQYEPPATKRQTEIAYQSTERQYKQAQVNYQTKLRQSEAKMSQAQAELLKERKKWESLMTLMQKFTVNAPANGMVIYAREWNGRKKNVGSQISSWDPTVATLPDMSQMESVTYVNEVDIQKVKPEQQVMIGLDADPNKKLSGTVVSVANIGEQRPNSNSKVFEVKVRIHENDTTLRPAMSTSNRIVVATVANVLSVPLECIHTDDGKTFVYKRNGSALIKQQVKVGQVNEEEAIIEQGVSDSDRVLMSLPADLSRVQSLYLP